MSKSPTYLGSHVRALNSGVKDVKFGRIIILVQHLLCLIVVNWSVANRRQKKIPRDSRIPETTDVRSRDLPRNLPTECLEM